MSFWEILIYALCHFVFLTATFVISLLIFVRSVSARISVSLQNYIHSYFTLTQLHVLYFIWLWIRQAGVADVSVQHWPKWPTMCRLIHFHYDREHFQCTTELLMSLSIVYCVYVWGFCHLSMFITTQHFSGHSNAMNLGRRETQSLKLKSFCDLKNFRKSGKKQCLGWAH